MNSGVTAAYDSTVTALLLSHLLSHDSFFSFFWHPVKRKTEERHIKDIARQIIFFIFPLFQKPKHIIVFEQYLYFDKSQYFSIYLRITSVIEFSTPKSERRIIFSQKGEQAHLWYKSEHPAFIYNYLLRFLCFYALYFLIFVD